MTGWKKLSSKELLKTKYFNVRADRLRLPDGAIKDPYYVIEREDAAFVFPVTTDGDVVLVRQYRPAIEKYDTCVPAGLVEEDEPPLEAARRELLEETGYGGGDWEKVATLSPSPGLKDNWAHIYLARGVEEISPQQPDEFERLEVIRVKSGDLLDMISSGGILSTSGVVSVLMCIQRVGEDIRQEG